MKKLALVGMSLLLNWSLGAFLFVNSPSAMILEKPETGSHIEDIVRYGTKVEITDEQGPWVHVQYPGESGWLLKENLLELQEDPTVRSNAVVAHRGAYVFNVADTEWGPFLTLPFETSIEVVEELPQAHQRWMLVRLQDGQTGYVQRSQLMLSKPHLTLPEMVEFSQQFLGTKYLWGGTTSFGYDCSGFTQMLYRQMGITIPRNAFEQAVDSRFIEVMPALAHAGDLVFFSNAFGKVVHTGMMINENDFIHACTKQESWISVSSLADERFVNGYFFFGLQVKRFQLP